MRHTLDITNEEIINCYTNEWVLEWCKKNHPEVFEKAKEIIKEYVEEDEK